MGHSREFLWGVAERGSEKGNQREALRKGTGLALGLPALREVVGNWDPGSVSSCRLTLDTLNLTR